MNCQFANKNCTGDIRPIRFTSIALPEGMDPKSPRAAGFSWVHHLCRFHRQEKNGRLGYGLTFEEQ